MATSLLVNDNRRFILSTPLLEDENRLQLQIPFKDERINELFKMKRTPQPYDYIKDLFEITADQDKLFSTFFTPTNGHKSGNYEGEGVRIRYDDLPDRLDYVVITHAHRRFDGSDFTRGFKIVEQLNARRDYVYAMGQEPWLTSLTSLQYTPESRPIVESDKLVAECQQRNIEAKRLFGCEAINLN